MTDKDLLSEKDRLALATDAKAMADDGIDGLLIAVTMVCQSQSRHLKQLGYLSPAEWQKKLEEAVKQGRGEIIKILEE